MSEPELKPCPFCGRSAKLSHSGDGEMCNVRCIAWDNGCRGAGQNAFNEQDAIKYWDTRATDAENQRLREALEPVINELHARFQGNGNVTDIELRDWVNKAHRALNQQGK